MIRWWSEVFESNLIQMAMSYRKDYVIRLSEHKVVSFYPFLKEVKLFLGNMHADDTEYLNEA